jgi:diguanylate cyclase (GGDEF)-like protein
LAELEGVASRELKIQLDRGFDAKRTLSLMMGVGAVAGLGYILFVRGRLRRDILEPVRHLTEAASLFAEGRLDHRAQVERADEIGRLAENFNAMADAIEDNQRRLTARAFADTVTGLPNRAALSQVIGTTVADGGGASVFPDCAMFIDVDDFKHVNDALGHDAGDAVLRLVADRLQAAVRDTDVLARVGGDEFAVVMVPPADEASARGVAQRMLDLLTVPFEVGGARVEIGVSIGMAVRTPDTEDPAELLQQADIAMYAAKANGKHRFEVYDPTNPAGLMARLDPDLLPGSSVLTQD